MSFKISTLVLLMSLIHAQAGWIKTFGADEEDGSNHVLKLEDGYLITGFTKSFGNGGYLSTSRSTDGSIFYEAKNRLSLC